MDRYSGKRLQTMTFDQLQQAAVESIVEPTDYPPELAELMAQLIAENDGETG